MLPAPADQVIQLSYLGHIQGCVRPGIETILDKHYIDVPSKRKNKQIFKLSTSNTCSLPTTHQHKGLEARKSRLKSDGSAL